MSAKTLYGKASVTEPIKAMVTHGRTAHGFLLTGEKGVGKKTAHFISRSLSYVKTSRTAFPAEYAASAKG